MGKNLFNLRFAVQRDDGYTSLPWRLWITAPGDVYLATKSSAGRAVFVGMAFTAESESSIRSALHAEEKQLVSFTVISHDEAFFIFSYSGTWENSDLKFPTAPGSIFPDLLFSEHDPTDTGRPIRICMASQPNDGDAVIIRELGGYKIQ